MKRAISKHRIVPAIALGVLTVLTVLGLAACGQSTDAAPNADAKRVIVLGFDGMDYDLTKKLMAEGRMPNFRKLAESGGFQPLQTAIPPQSPVAWSDFITGLDSGGHGIFDFVHRHPDTMTPYLSTSESIAEAPLFTFGEWQIPGSGEVRLLRHGRAFWEPLEAKDVPTAILRMPANFPPSETASFELTGMGTPDLPGDPGRFSFYTSELFAFSGQELSGGEVYEVDAFDNVVRASLYGPVNPFRVDGEKAEAPFTAYIDPKEDVVKLVVGSEKRVLTVGEWSDWVPIEFDLVSMPIEFDLVPPIQAVGGMARFYLKQAHPEFELYVSPIQIDPMNPALPVSHPAGFAAELAEATGRFYTQGMMEDTKALSDGVFDVDEFLSQAKVAGEEIRKQYPYVLKRFDEGLLFYYFGNVDQVSHMMWKTLDPTHPGYDPEVDPQYADVIPKLYEEMDRVVGYTLKNMGPDATLVVMSDHGFSSWRRAFNLNSWLRDNGFLAVKDPNLQRDPGLFGNVDWSKTKAYSLGINGLYVNLEGREKNGIVKPADKEKVMRELKKALLATRDPQNDQPAVTKVYFAEEAYDDRGYLDLGPDIQVGYAKGYRGSNETALGELTPEVITDNLEPWSGDHCMDHEVVPGILLTNKKLPKPAKSLEDLAAAILAEMGVEKFPLAEKTSGAKGAP